MRKLLLFVLAAVAFAACEQAPIEEAQGVVMSDRSLEVSFEGADDTRIQLQNGKTVWTKGDHVSVFYCSTVNEEWQFMGETGDRTGQIVPIDNSVNPPATHNHVVVAYPYSEDYFYNTETHNIEASLPAVQNYLKDSYGTNGNIMISSSEFNKVSLKSVCGWLKLQLTGDGEVVKSITLRGNNGEQVAGLIYVDSATATATLASVLGEAGDGEVGGTLVRPGTILTEVTLDCGDGVTLGKSATAFYIALPPQTFANGFTVDIECEDYELMTLTTEKELVIERNHIQPMASVEHNAEHNAEQIIPNNEIWYTNGSTTKATTPNKTNAFGANIASNTYDAAKECWVIKFDGKVTTIGDYAFKYCYSLTSVTIPDSVTTIGSYAFSDCSSLTSVTIPDSVTTIGNHAFYYCSSLTSVTIGDSVTTIGYSAFRDCSSLTSVTIPDSVTTIGDYAFFVCSSLESVTIGDSVTEIGEGVFADCTSLKEFKGKYATEDGRSLIVDNTIIAYANDSGTTYTILDSVTTIGRSAFNGCSRLTSVTIPDSVTTIGVAAFYNCSSLTSVTIPDSVTMIGGEAFGWCSILTSVTIGDSVTTIGEYAFYNCDSLTNVTIPDSVTTIRWSVFSDCSNLTSVTIGDSITSIGSGAFLSCSSLQEFKGKFASDNGRCLIVNGTLNSFAPAGLTEYTIPDIVTTIEDNAFRFCSSLTSVTIPDSVTTIGIYAFHGCSSLTSVTIGDSVTSIGNYAFEDCTSLTSVTIPDSVKEIGKNAFYKCIGLTSVTIPDSVTKIGDYVFYSCHSLTSVYCKATTPPTGGYSMFSYNASGRKIYVPMESVEAYKSKYGWSSYSDYIEGYNF